MQISDGIHNYRYKFLLISILTLLFSTFLYYPAFAQSEEEMKLLQMYFGEDELVVSATRTLKPLSQVAENISIVTAEEIEAMNAHTVAEVLDRVTGVFVSFQGHDFGSSSIIEIQGSEERHVLVLLDGVPWNFMSDGETIINSIPVRIIKRIEVVKGPASSSWGSALGGVINIVTKDTGDSDSPSGTLTASYGERHSQDYSAEVFGRAGLAGYYIYAGRQDADGLRNDRYFNNDSVYAKADFRINSDATITFSAGYSEPHIRFDDLPSYDIASRSSTRAFFATLSFNAALTDSLRAEANVYNFQQKFARHDTEILAPQLYLDYVNDEDSLGGSAKLIWKDNGHNAVLGVDISDGNLDQTLIAGQFLQSYGVQETRKIGSGIEKWAVFFNDTFSTGKLAVTPGIRFDHNNVSGDFTSPSLGMTYRIGDNHILRASVAKGFTTPPLIFTSGGFLFGAPNPDLRPEKVWSYQAGIESRVPDILRARFTYFHHDMKDEFKKTLDAAGPFMDMYFNVSEVKRDGIEVEIETAPFNNVSVKSGFSYFHKRLYFEEATSEDVYAWNVSVKYDDLKSFSALLNGHYIWWDLDSSEMAEYDAVILDLSINKKIYSSENVDAAIFFAAHNLLNGSQYRFGGRKNPSRWVEAGMRLKF